MSRLIPVNHRSVLALAVPIMLANVSEPLIGIVDTTVIGQLPESYYIGAVAVGTLIFSFAYWGFGFLRMGTGGLAAQAFGAGDADELAAVASRALIIAAAIGVALLIVAPLIATLAFRLIEASPEIERQARIYFNIRIWSAPFALANYVFLGWFIGIGAMRTAFALQLLLNLTNMALDALFVLSFGMATAGIGYGTLIAEVTAALAGGVMLWRTMVRLGAKPSLAAALDGARMKKMFGVNADIMVRTVCLTFAFSWFTAQGARVSDTVVAANAVLMQFFTFGAFLIDGFAHAAEALTGQSVGAGDRDRYRLGIRISSLWALVVAAAVSLIIVGLGPWLIAVMTVNEAVRAMAGHYLILAALTPFLGAACFQLDGIFIGATRTRDMRNMMLVSVVVFLVCGYTLLPAMGNTGLWLALIVFFVMRGITLGVRLPALERDAFRV